MTKMSNDLNLEPRSPLITSIKAIESHLQEYVTQYQPRLKLRHIRLIEKLISDYMIKTPEQEINRDVYDILLILDDTVESKKKCQKNK